MTDFKVGDKAEVLTGIGDGWLGVQVTVSETGRRKHGGVWDLEVTRGDGSTGLVNANELKLVKPEPKFKVGDWVKVHGRHDKWDGTVGTVVTVSPKAYSHYGHLYTILRNNKAVGEDHTLRFFEGALEATEAPKPVLKEGDWAKAVGYGQAGGSFEGRVGEVVGVHHTTIGALITLKYPFVAGKAAQGTFDSKYIQAAEAPKPEFVNLHNYAEFDAKLTAKVLGRFEDKPAPLKIYLAGPMSGIEHYNFPAFFTAARKLRAAGHTVFNPAENDMDGGFNALGMEGHEAADHGFSLREALKTDLSWICENADALVLLEGWESSKGVRAEMALAEALGLPKYEMAKLPAEVAK